MKIIYISAMISEKKFAKIFETAKEKPLQSIQKYHRLLCKGLVSNDVETEAISVIPMSRKISTKLLFFDKQETEDGIKFTYVPFINIKFVRQIFTIIFSFIKIFIKIIKSKKSDLFVCDILNTNLSIATVIMCKIFKRKNIALVTDLPRDINSGSFSSKVNQFFQSKFDAYILLTEYMNEVVNEKNKPYIVIEGFSDIKDENDFIKKKNICMYAGGLYEKYGIKLLIDAFDKIQNDNYELHLYGHGDMIDYLANKKFKNIKYMGILKNDQIIEKEKEAALLINPRFSNFNYTKYSFPSKIMEYMASGTPVLTTKLPGIPDEYYEFLYTFDDESLEGFIKTINDVLRRQKTELDTKGNSAKKFVMKFKNNVVQTKKLKNFLEKIFNMEVENE